MATDADQRAGKVVVLARLYQAAFVASMVLSLIVAAATREPPAATGPGASLVDRIAAPVAALLEPPHAAAPQEAASAAAAGRSAELAEVLGRLHPAPSLPLALVEMAAVVAISAMWFFAFTLRAARRHPAGAMRSILAHSGPVLASPIPVVIFVLAMYQAYQPAVLVMALVAILVAAEHYSGLTLQERELDEQRKQLTRQARDAQVAQAEQARALQAQAEMLQQHWSALQKQAETLKAASADLKELNKSTTRLLSDAGLSQFIGAVYASYLHAPCIRAVVRLHEIDTQWWKWARDAVASGEGGKLASDPWATYFAFAREQDEMASGLTLARALQVTDRRPRVSGAFVTDLPMPGSREWLRRSAESEEPLFQDLLGLAWQLVVLNQVRADSQGACTLSAWVSRPLCWVHATDSKVFQVLRREPREQSALLIIADTSLDETLRSAAELESSRSLLAWAHDEIQRYVERGTRAEDYVFGALRYAMIEASKYDSTQLVRMEAHGGREIPRATPDLQYLLSVLGSGFWCTSKARASNGAGRIRDDDDLIAIAGDVFARLIHDTAARVEGQPAGIATELALELL